MNTSEALSILGLQPGATTDQIKAAYRAKSKEWHPDKAKATVREAHEQKMKDINAAYTFLEQHGAGGGSYQRREGARQHGPYHGFDYGYGGFGFDPDELRRQWEKMAEQFNKYSYRETYRTTKHMCQHCGGTGYVHRTERTKGEPNF